MATTIIDLQKQFIVYSFTWMASNLDVAPFSQSNSACKLLQDSLFIPFWSHFNDVFKNPLAQKRGREKHVKEGQLASFYSVLNHFAWTPNCQTCLGQSLQGYNELKSWWYSNIWQAIHWSCKSLSASKNVIFLSLCLITSSDH